MGVYIPNMEKPKSCGECKFFCGLGYGFYCYLNERNIIFIGEIESFCPLIEISETKYHNMVVALDILEHEQNDCIEAERRADE